MPRILEKHDTPLGMSHGIGKIAARQNIEITVPVKVGHDRLGRSIHREEVAFDEIILAVVFQDPDAMVRLEYTGIIKIVAVHI